MKCYSCDRLFKAGQQVVMTIQGEVVNGQFEPVEEETISHYEC